MEAEEPIEFTSSGGWLLIAVEAKQPNRDAEKTIFTLKHYEEMLKFEDWLNNLAYPVPIGNETADLAAGEPRTMLKYSDICGR